MIVIIRETLSNKGLTMMFDDNCNDSNDMNAYLNNDNIVSLVVITITKHIQAATASSYPLIH